MAKGDSDVVRLAGRYVSDLFSNAGADVPLIYRGFKRSRELVDDCREVAKGNKLNGGDDVVVLLSAWFYDAGSVAMKEGGRAKSIELARAFLASQGQPESLADAVAACLTASGGED